MSEPNRYLDGITTEAMRDANARLIAAAPELYEALRKCAWFIENVSEDTPNRSELFFECREAWRAALAKVTP